MSVDLKRTFADLESERGVFTGATFEEEGQLVVGNISTGVELAAQGAAAASQVLLGFAKKDTVSPAGTRMYGTDGQVPAASPYTVDIGHTLVTADLNAFGDVQVFDVTADAYLTLIAGPTPASGEVDLLDATAGTLDFHADEAGHEIQILARVTMTARERDGIYQQRHINSNAQADLELIGYWTGRGEIYMDQFDAAVTDWDTGTLRTDASGFITTAAGGTDISGLCRVISVPSADDPWLGLSFNIG